MLPHTKVLSPLRSPMWCVSFPVVESKLVPLPLRSSVSRVLMPARKLRPYGLSFPRSSPTLPSLSFPAVPHALLVRPSELPVCSQRQFPVSCTMGRGRVLSCFLWVFSQGRVPRKGWNYPSSRYSFVQQLKVPVKSSFLADVSDQTPLNVWQNAQLPFSNLAHAYRERPCDPEKYRSVSPIPSNRQIKHNCTG